MDHRVLGAVGHKRRRARWLPGWPAIWPRPMTFSWICRRPACVPPICARHFSRVRCAPRRAAVAGRPRPKPRPAACGTKSPAHRRKADAVATPSPTGEYCREPLLPMRPLWQNSIDAVRERVAGAAHVGSTASTKRLCVLRPRDDRSIEREATSSEHPGSLALVITFAASCPHLVTYRSLKKSLARDRCALDWRE